MGAKLRHPSDLVGSQHMPSLIQKATGPTSASCFDGYKCITLICSELLCEEMCLLGIQKTAWGRLDGEIGGGIDIEEPLDVSTGLAGNKGGRKVRGGKMRRGSKSDDA